MAASPLSEYVFFPCPVWMPSKGGSPSPPLCSAVYRSFIQTCSVVSAAPPERPLRCSDHCVWMPSCCAASRSVHAFSIWFRFTHRSIRQLQ
nr:unnamed protein product [Digitaria exilis]